MERVIDTKVKNTPVTRDIFRGVLGQLSDGIWENSNACTSYWVCCDVNSDGDTIKLEIDTSPMCDYCGSTMSNRYFRMSNADILRYFATKMSQIVKIEGKDSNNAEAYAMKADNQTPCEYLNYESGVKVCDVYAVRKALMEVAK